MTGLWSVTHCAFASCAPMSTTPETEAELIKKTELLKEVLRTMLASVHTNLDSPVSEEGIEMELDKSPYYANARSDDANLHPMIDATQGNLPTRVEDSNHGKGVVDHATTTAALQSSPMALTKKVSLLLQRRWSKRSNHQPNAAIKNRTTQILGEVPEATVASSSEDSSRDFVKEKKGSCYRSDLTFDGSGMFPGQRKHVADAVGLKRTQQKSRSPHARDDVSTLSSSTGGDGASKSTKSGNFSTVRENDDQRITALLKTNDATPVKTDKLLHTRDINVPQVPIHRRASIENSIVVKEGGPVKRDLSFSLKNDPAATCEPSATARVFAAEPQGATLSKIPICQYDVSLMRKPLFDPEEDDSEDENQVDGILKMVAKRSLVKDCFQMDMKEPQLLRYNLNQCNQSPIVLDATSGNTQDPYTTRAARTSGPKSLEKSTSVDAVEISVAVSDESESQKSPPRKDSSVDSVLDGVCDLRRHLVEKCSVMYHPEKKLTRFQHPSSRKHLAA
jgi:hypothetical protein